MGKPTLYEDLNIKSQVKYYEKSLGRPLNPDEQENLNTYGVISAQEMEDHDDLLPGQCICGAFECNESYEHYTSGY